MCHSCSYVESTEIVHPLLLEHNFMVWANSPVASDDPQSSVVLVMASSVLLVWV